MAEVTGPGRNTRVIPKPLFCELTLTLVSDGAITIGMVLLCEAASSDLEVGKRKSTLPTHQLLLSGFLQMLT